MKSRGCVGIEPTQDSACLPRNGFEDRTPHQRCSIPTLNRDYIRALDQIAQLKQATVLFRKLIRY